MVENVTQVSEDYQLPTDVLFDILSQERRRLALYCLERYQAPMTLADLADEVARLEYDAETLHHVSEEDLKGIYIGLYHLHIPKMEEAHLLEYSQERDSVCLIHDLSELHLAQLRR